VFGHTSAFSAALNLSALDATSGLKLNGAGAFQRSGWSMSGAGDVNGDGAADVIIGAPYASPNGTYSGASHVVFGPSKPLDVSKMKIGLNFATPGKDSVSIKGTIRLPDGFSPAGQKLRINVGGVIKSYVLDGKGAVKSGADAFKLQIKSSGGVVEAQDAPFTISFKKGDFDDFYLDEGLINSNVKSEQVSILTNIFLGHEFSSAMVPQSYTAKQGKSGKTK